MHHRNHRRPITLFFLARGSHWASEEARRRCTAGGGLCQIFGKSGNHGFRIFPKIRQSATPAVHRRRTSSDAPVARRARKSVPIGSGRLGRCIGGVRIRSEHLFPRTALRGRPKWRGARGGTPQKSRKKWGPPKRQNPGIPGNRSRQGHIWGLASIVSGV